MGEKKKKANEEPKKKADEEAKKNADDEAKEKADEDAKKKVEVQRMVEVEMRVVEKVGGQDGGEGYLTRDKDGMWCSPLSITDVERDGIWCSPLHWWELIKAISLRLLKEEKERKLQVVRGKEWQIV